MTENGAVRKSVLYISYDGMLEPLGQSQVLAYVEKLAVEYDIHVLSFEKPADWRDEALRRDIQQRFAASGMHWHPRRYHKRPSGPATLFDVGQGILSGLCLIARHGIGLVHARSYVASVIALVLSRVTGAAFLFDMRGFWADERVDAGLWPRNGTMYRIAKWFERQFLLKADHVVSLTHAGLREISRFPYLAGRMPRASVIPTCADLDLFRPDATPRSEQYLVGYVGSAGTWYLFDEVLRCFTELRKLRCNAHLLVVNRGEHDYIKMRAKLAGIPEDSMELISALHREMPMHMARLDAAIFFIKPAYSKQASAPTKLGELLACGIPCMGNSGVGDMAELLEGEQVGVAVSSFTPESLREGLVRLIELSEDPAIRERCADAAQRHFALLEGVSRYRNIYRGLLQQ